MYPYYKSKNQSVEAIGESKSPLPFLCSRSDKTNFDSCFMAFIDLSIFFCYFALVLLWISSTIGTGIGVLSLPDT